VGRPGRGRPPRAKFLRPRSIELVDRWIRTRYESLCWPCTGRRRKAGRYTDLVGTSVLRCVHGPAREPGRPSTTFARRRRLVRGALRRWPRPSMRPAQSTHAAAILPLLGT
jgi:hypothetical protein